MHNPDEGGAGILMNNTDRKLLEIIFGEEWGFCRT